MSQDISTVLEGWDFEPHELNVRVITGRDGQRKIQMRIDLGMMQMNIEGRPDGLRPFGFDTALDYLENQKREYGKGFSLSSESADELFREAWQYYHRYCCLFQLDEFDLVVRDTERSLKLFAFGRKYSKRKRDIARFEQHWPNVLMMSARAKAMIALNKDQKGVAILAIHEGIRQITEFEATREHRRGDECFELEFLRKWLEDLDEKASARSPSRESVDELRTSLNKAIGQEDYEAAALLRDQIRRIEQSHNVRAS